MSNHALKSEEHGLPQADLLEQVLEHENLTRAWKRVRSNRGAPGIDGMTLERFPEFAREHLQRICDQIRQGRYAPAAVRRVWIPKPNGDLRPLGIPTVLDRVIQQAVAQVLGPIFDADFSEYSYGFRLRRRAHDAIQHLSKTSQDGNRWGVECDLKGFFDEVNHDLLMHQVGLKVRDKRLLRLIGKYLRAGVKHENGQTDKTLKGVPQGGPLSPLLANIMLNPLDRLIESMGLAFVRYADDFLILARDRARAQYALERVREYVQSSLKLLVNEDKSSTAPIRDCEILGFKVAGKQIRASEKAIKRFKQRIVEITSRSRGVSMWQRIRELKLYCTGWFHYFKLGLSYKQMKAWDSWIRRRIRLCYWKDWKRPGKRRRMLIKLGIDKDRVKLASRSRKGYWRMSANSIVQQALTDDWLAEQGVTSMTQMWIRFKYGERATA